jgi:hypothetical protein
MKELETICNNLQDPNNDELRLFSKTDSADIFQTNKQLLYHLNIYVRRVQAGVPDEHTISKLPQDKSYFLYLAWITQILADEQGAEQEEDAHEALSLGLSASCHAVLPCWPF